MSGAIQPQQQFGYPAVSATTCVGFFKLAQIKVPGTATALIGEFSRPVSASLHPDARAANVLPTDRTSSNLMIERFTDIRHWRLRHVLIFIRKMLVSVLSHPIWTGIGVLVVVVVALLNSNFWSDPPASPGVYSLRSIVAGKRLTETLVEARDDGSPVTHLHPVRVQDVIGLCLTHSVEKNTRLTLTHLKQCAAPTK